MSTRIAYIMSRFPHLPETFILREMAELEQQGWQIDLYPLIIQKQSVVHHDAQHWIPRAHHLPFASASMLATSVQKLVEAPHTCADIYARALWENRTSRGFFARTLALLPKALHAAHLMRRANIRHIHAHYATHPALVAWIIHRLTGISYSVTVHAHDIFVDTSMLATKLRDAAAIVAISEYNRDYLSRVVGAWITDKTHIIHCGIVPAHYTPRSVPPDPHERFEIVSIGSLQPYKGHPYLIEACALLRDRGLPFRCRIIGGGADQAMLERMIADNHLEQSVELLGPRPQEEVARILPTAHCYVQPSIITPSGKMEGIPVALMEALACALPVIATSLSGIPELVRHGETGYLAPPADATALADLLTTLFQHPQEAARLGAAGRRLVLDEFELHQNVEQLTALFNKIIHKKSPCSGDTRYDILVTG